jgi:signal recognition particle receptor subunit beta
VAVLDRDRNVIVIRVVYDGPPEAGKTTSLKALAASLRQPLRSPAEEYGRTLYFDWMDYTAGRFDGYQIRCQIVSVPGQRELTPRRFRLLKDADVVVYVGDSTRARLRESLEGLREMSRFVERTARPPVGVLFQANKRDLTQAMPLEELRKLINTGGRTIGVTESVATDGTGIRETFVFAVRLALDRVREQVRTGSLDVGRPEIDSSAALLDYLQRNESRPPPALGSVAPLLRGVLAENDEEQIQAPARDSKPDLTDEARPRSPDPAVPSGSIWPPVEGRLILQEAAATPMTAHRLRSGGWTAGLGHGFRIFSAADAVFSDLEAGRATLIRTARLHAACKGLISDQRCIVLSATGQGSWRLWQIVRAERPLRERFSDIGRCETEEAAKRIVDAAALLCDVGARLQGAPCNLPCTLDTVGCTDDGPIYIGLMPHETRNGPSADVSYAIGAQLGSIIRGELQERRGQVLSAVARHLFHEQNTPHGGRLLDEVLTQMSAG